MTIKSLFGFCRLGEVLGGLVGLFVVAGSAQAVMGQQQTVVRTDGEEYAQLGYALALSSDGRRL